MQLDLIHVEEEADDLFTKELAFMATFCDLAEGVQAYVEQQRGQIISCPIGASNLRNDMSDRGETERHRNEEISPGLTGSP